jgi:hypothetical protein
MSSFSNPNALSASSKFVEPIAPVISEGLIQSIEEESEQNKAKKAEKGNKVVVQVEVGLS